MDAGLSHLHFALHGENVLFASLKLNSPSSFLVAAFLTAVICLTERALTYTTSSYFFSSSRLFSLLYRSRIRRAAWRAGLFSIVTTLRLLYMLIAMTSNLGLITVIIFSLTLGQFFAELFNPQPSTSSRDQQGNYRRLDIDHNNEGSLKESLLYGDRHTHNERVGSSFWSSTNDFKHSCDEEYGTELRSATMAGATTAVGSFSSRSSDDASKRSPPRRTLTPPQQYKRARPQLTIPIHPIASNFARAEAAAASLHGRNQDAHVNRPFSDPQTEFSNEAGWEAGQGKEAARTLLGKPQPREDGTRVRINSDLEHQERPTKKPIFTLSSRTHNRNSSAVGLLASPSSTSSSDED